MKLKSILACALLLAFFSPAKAAPVTFEGSALGAFGLANPFQDTVVFQGLTFNAFDDGFKAVADPVGGPAFGQFTLNPNIDFNYTNTVFRLQVTFTAPEDIMPSDTSVFTATLLGKIQQGNEGVKINFGALEQEFTFDGGSFTLSVNSITLSQGNSLSQPLEGTIVVTSSVPDGGATAALLGCSFIGLAYVRNRFALLKA